MRTPEMPGNYRIWHENDHYKAEINGQEVTIVGNEEQITEHLGYPIPPDGFLIYQDGTEGVGSVHSSRIKRK